MLRYDLLLIHNIIIPYDYYRPLLANCVPFSVECNIRKAHKLDMHKHQSLFIKCSGFTECSVSWVYHAYECSVSWVYHAYKEYSRTEVRPWRITG